MEYHGHEKRGMEKFEAIDMENFFITKSMGYTYCLLRLEGAQRNKLLGITDDCYTHESIAYQWKKRMYRYILSDIENPFQELAISKVNKLYDIMTDKE